MTLMPLWLMLSIWAIAAELLSGGRDWPCFGRRVARRRALVALLDRIRVDKHVPALVEAHRVAAQRLYVFQVAGVIASQVVGRAMESAVEAPVLALVAQQPIGMPAPARQRQEAVLAAH